MVARVSVSGASGGLALGVDVGAYDFGRDLRDDGIAVGAELSHSGGNPMSQQTNAGFNAPGFPIGAGEPFGSDPSAAARIATSPAELPASLFPFLARDRLVGVGHIEAAWRGNWSSLVRSDPSGFVPVVAMPGLSFQSRELGVAHRVMAFPSVSPKPFPLFAVSLHRSRRAISLSRSVVWNSFRVGVGHKPEAISSMGRIDGTSRDNGSPEGVADAFQVRMHSVEPILSNRRRNLLSHDDSGAAGSDEAEELGPEVALVFLPLALSGNGERLAGAATGPQRATVGPSSKSSCIGPTADTCEEVALDIALEVVGLDIDNAPFIDIARRDTAGGDQVAQPLRGVGIELVVVGPAHSRPSPVIHRGS